MVDDDRQPDDGAADRELEGLTFKVVVVEAIVAVLLVLALVCGWTLHDLPALDIHPDPAGALPF